MDAALDAVRTRQIGTRPGLAGVLPRDRSACSGRAGRIVLPRPPPKPVRPQLQGLPPGPGKLGRLVYITSILRLKFEQVLDEKTALDRPIFGPVLSSAARIWGVLSTSCLCSRVTANSEAMNSDLWVSVCDPQTTLVHWAMQLFPDGGDPHWALLCGAVTLCARVVERPVSCLACLSTQSVLAPGARGAPTRAAAAPGPVRRSRQPSGRCSPRSGPRPPCRSRPPRP